MKTLSIVTMALSITIFCATISHADEWAKAYGGSDEDFTFSIQETTTGEYITAGYTYSFGAGDSDAWVVKLNSDGTISWQNSYGGSDYDWAYAINEISGPGYIAAGYTESFGAGGADAWVLKLTSTGTVSWSKAYGGAASEEFYSVQEVAGGYIAAGRTTSFGAGDSDAWVVKLNSDGTIISWQNRYGGTDFDSATCIQETDDGGYILLVEHWSEAISKVCQEDNGISCETDDDCVIGLDYGPCIEIGPDSNIVVMKLNADGTVAWQKTYGDLDNDSASCIQQTSDLGYILAGNTRSFGGISKALVLKLTSAGAISWQKTYGGDWSYASSIKETSDLNYILAGYTYDYGAGFSDSWLLKIEGEGVTAGDIMWQKTYGGNDFDWVYSVLETSTNEYLLAARTRSYGAGYDDVLVLKVDSNGDIPDCSIIDTSTATATDTTISAEDSYLTITATTATITDVSVSDSGTTATIEGICPVSGVDSDSDGIPDASDNCPNTPNGPNGGTCTSGTIGESCMSDGECGGGTCSVNQEDIYPPGGNDIGDVCDCEANFDCDEDVDAEDVTTFLIDFGRNAYSNPCETGNQCKGDFGCDGDVDAVDVTKFLEDFGRNAYSNPCPTCVEGDWCEYPL